MEKTSIEIIKKLRKAGHETYWAGGCVRDILLGVDPKDYDIVTSANPDEIKKTVGAKETLYTGSEINSKTPLNSGYRNIQEIFYKNN